MLATKTEKDDIKDEEWEEEEDEAEEKEKEKGKGKKSKSERSGLSERPMKEIRRCTVSEP